MKNGENKNLSPTRKPYTSGNLMQQSHTKDAQYASHGRQQTFPSRLVPIVRSISLSRLRKLFSWFRSWTRRAVAVVSRSVAYPTCQRIAKISRVPDTSAESFTPSVARHAVIGGRAAVPPYVLLDGPLGDRLWGGKGKDCSKKVCK